MNASELMRLWSERDRPVLYSSPSRDIAVNCPGSGSDNISNIFVGAYSSMYGSGEPGIEIGGHSCSVSTEPATGGVNVYECVLNRFIRSQTNPAEVLLQVEVATPSWLMMGTLGLAAGTLIVLQMPSTFTHTHTQHLTQSQGNAVPQLQGLCPQRPGSSQHPRD